MRTRPGWLAALGVVLFAPWFAYAQTTTPTVEGSASASASMSASSIDAHEAPPEEIKTKKVEVVVPLSIMGGLRAGGALNLGRNSPENAPTNDANHAIGGIDLALEGGATIYDHFYGGLIFGGTFYISPGSTTKNVSSVMFGTEVGYLTNPRGFGAFFGLGFAYRAFYVSDALGNANKYDGVEALATAALHIKIGDLIRVLPRVDFAFGPTVDSVHAIVIVGFSVWFNDQIFPHKHAHAD